MALASATIKPVKSMNLMEAEKHCVNDVRYESVGDDLLLSDEYFEIEIIRDEDGVLRFKGPHAIIAKFERLLGRHEASAPATE